MRDVHFIEAVAEKLLNTREPDGSLPPDILRTFADHTDKELTALRNLYRIRTRGDNLVTRTKEAAEKAADEELMRLADRLSYLSRNDRQLEAGLKGALHCFQYMLQAKPDS